MVLLSERIRRIRRKRRARRAGVPPGLAGRMARRAGELDQSGGLDGDEAMRMFIAGEHTRVKQQEAAFLFGKEAGGVRGVVEDGQARPSQGVR